MLLILYDFFADNKINVCFIKETNFYCLIQENEGIYEEMLVGNLSDNEKKDMINDLSVRSDIPDFFKDYIKNKITTYYDENM